MKYILDIQENKIGLAEEFFKSVSFIKNVRAVASNEITNNAILQSIESYENEIVKPTPLSLSELKKMLDASITFYAQSMERSWLVDAE